MYGWRKACCEFVKRMDPDLGFYYHTSTHQRFYEGEMPAFDIPAAKPKQKRVAQRELLSGGVGGRVTMAQRGAGSIRSKFHNVPVELPPPPSITLTQQQVLEHSYA